MRFGDHVRNRRKDMKRSLRSVATALGVNAAYLSRVESGKVSPSNAMLDALARELAIDQAELSLLAGRVPENWLPAIYTAPDAATNALRRALRLAENGAPYRGDGQFLMREGGDGVIEDGFPFERVSEVAEAESWRKEIYRPIYHVHKWWAQRLGSVFRAILLAAAAPQGSDLMRLFYQPAQLPGMVVFDPFMGSGTTIGEALKLGCTAIGWDINPVAHMAVRTALGPLDRRDLRRAFQQLDETVGQEIRDLYRGLDGRGRACRVLYYFWVKQVACPSCGHDVELFSTYIFSKHAYPRRHPEALAACPTCSAIIQTRYDAQQAVCHDCATTFNPQQGPAKQSTAVCAACGGEFAIARTMREVGAPTRHRMYAKLVLDDEGNKHYLPIDDLDRQLYDQACERLRGLRDAYPETPLRDGYNTRQVINYGYRSWHQMFNERQLLALALLGRAIADLPAGSTRDALFCLFSGTLEFNNMFASFKGEGTGAVRHMFAHHVLKPERMPLEANVWGTPKSSGSFSTLFESRLLRALDYREMPFEVRVRPQDGRAQTQKVYGLSAPLGTPIAGSYAELCRQESRLYLACGSSAHTDIPADSVDMIVTDPPFFDNVHYSELADFFYVWHRHFLGAHDGADGFTTRHEQEVQQTDAASFSRNLGAVFAECNRVLKEDGLLVFTYHHSREEGWIAVAKAVFSSGLGFMQAQPVKAEMSGATPKAGAKEPIDLDMILVCRKWHHASPRAGRPNSTALAAAAEQIARLNAAGRRLSRNDVRIIVMGQVLVDASTAQSADVALRTVEHAAAWTAGEVERLYRSQDAQRKNASPSLVQTTLFA